MSTPDQAARRAINDIPLDDKYALDATRAYMTGIEALVRLLTLSLAQKVLGLSASLPRSSEDCTKATLETYI